MMRTRGRHGEPRNDSGYSLVELTVTMMIFGIVVAATVALSIGFTRTNAATSSRQDGIDTARYSVATMSKTVRTAVKQSQVSTTCVGSCAGIDAFLLGQDSTVRFHANVNNHGNTAGPSLVTYSVVDVSAGQGRLIEKVQQPDSATPASGAYAYCDAEAAGASAECKARLRVRTLAEGVHVDTGRPLFAYFDTSGAPMLPSAHGGSLNDDSLASMMAVEITLTVEDQAVTRAQPTTYIQRITLPNAQSVMRLKDGP